MTFQHCSNLKLGKGAVCHNDSMALGTFERQDTLAKDEVLNIIMYLLDVKEQDSASQKPNSREVTHRDSLTFHRLIFGRRVRNNALPFLELFSVAEYSTHK